MLVRLLVQVLAAHRAESCALLAADDLAGQIEQWVSLINTAIDPVMIRQYLLAYIFPKGADGKPDRKVIEAALPDLQKQIALLDGANGKGGASKA